MMLPTSSAKIPPFVGGGRSKTSFCVMTCNHDLSRLRELYLSCQSEPFVAPASSHSRSSMKVNAFFWCGYNFVATSRAINIECQNHQISGVQQSRVCRRTRFCLWQFISVFHTLEQLVHLTTLDFNALPNCVPSSHIRSTRSHIGYSTVRPQ